MTASVTTANERWVLIVEDDAEVRTLCTMAFQAEGYSVVSAASAPEALDLLRTTRVDALVTDFSLHGETGAALIHQAANERLLDPLTTPTLIYTGYAVVVPPPHVEVLHKPLPPADLVRCITEKLGSPVR